MTLRYLLLSGALLLSVAAAALPARALQTPGDVVPVMRGRVVDAEGAPVAGVRVRALAEDRGAVTDRDGRFELRGLLSGRQRLEASRWGYAPAFVEVELGSSSPLTLEIALRATPLELPEVVVTAAPTAGSALSPTRSALQLSGRALERNVSASVAETLAGQPGLAVRYNGPAAAAPVVRGLDGDRVLLLQDGHRVADLSGSADDHMVTVDPLSAQRIEVVRGPAALLYGNNALGGVVNVLTEDGETRVPAGPEASLALQAESAYPGGAAHGSFTAPLSDTWALGLRASARLAGDVQLGSDAGHGRTLPNTSMRSAGGALSAAHASPSLVAAATLRALAFEYGLPFPPEDDSPVTLEGRSVTAAVRAQAALPSSLFPTLRVSASAHDYAHDELTEGVVDMAFALRTAMLDARVRQAPRGPIREGAWGLSATFKDYVATGIDQLTAPAGTRAFGAFAYQELPLAGSVSLQLGGRLDRHETASRDDPRFGRGISRAFTAASGSVGAAVPFSGGRGNVGLGLARSFRAPTVEELFSSAPHAGTGAFEIGDPDLRPETMRGVEAVLRWTDEGIVADVAAYGGRMDGFIAFTPRGDTLVDGAPWPVLVYTQEEAGLRGLEASLEAALSRRLVLGLQGDAARTERRSGVPIPFSPAARVGASLRWESPRFAAGGGLEHAFARRRTAGEADVPTDAYTLLDAHASLTLDRAGATHSLTLRVTNALDVSYRDAASRVKRFAPNPGRNVSLLYRVGR